jgi:2-polyprenyl-3-methyl-5-hydroxy-6-metoxy-1,4-benzoquinol methylase
VDVKQFWSDRAGDKSLDDVAVTHKDVWQRWLEIETIRRFVKPHHRILDVGCGAGIAAGSLPAMSRRSLVSTSRRK